MEEDKNISVFKIIKEIIFSALMMGLFSVLQYLSVGFAVAFASIYAILRAMSGDDYYLKHSIIGFATGKDGMMLATLLAGVTTSLLFGLWWFVRNRNYGKAKSRFKKGVKVITSKLHIVMLVAIAAYGAVELIAVIEALLIPDMVKAYNEMAKQFIMDSVLVNILSMSILAPIAEECLFRGIILDHLKGCMNIYVAIAIQALLFGIMHGNVVQGLFVLPMGIAMGFVAAKADSVLPAIIIHGIFNGISYALTFLPDEVASSASLSGMLLVVPFVAMVVLYNLAPRDEFGQIIFKL